MSKKSIWFRIVGGLLGLALLALLVGGAYRMGMMRGAALGANGTTSGAWMMPWGHNCATTQNEDGTTTQQNCHQDGMGGGHGRMGGGMMGHGPRGGFFLFGGIVRGLLLLFVLGALARLFLFRRHRCDCTHPQDWRHTPPPPADAPTPPSAGDTSTPAA